jgi:Na+/proline symporter
MHWIDWCILIIPVSCVMWLAFYSRRYARGVADFLAAGRVAGRYVI